jgi:ATP-dependent DNA helicase RecQ
MVSYAKSGYCGWSRLPEYFSKENGQEHCNHCDSCPEPPEQALPPTHAAREDGVEGDNGDKAGLPEENALEAAVVAHPAFAAGMAVRVPRVGKGQVVGSTKESITILFSDSRTWAFLKSHLKPAGNAPPRSKQGENPQ